MIANVDIKEGNIIIYYDNGKSIEIPTSVKGPNVNRKISTNIKTLIGKSNIKSWSYNKLPIIHKTQNKYSIVLLYDDMSISIIYSSEDII